MTAALLPGPNYRIIGPVMFLDRAAAPSRVGWAPPNQATSATKNVPIIYEARVICWTPPH